MSCQCYEIGGPFIAEDPDCPAHGTAARHDLIDRLRQAYRQGHIDRHAGLSADEWIDERYPYTHE